MNALPMNLMVTPTPAAAPAPAAGTPPRGAPDSGFAQCLGQAVEREPVAAKATARDDAAVDAEATGEAQGGGEGAGADAAPETRTPHAARRGPAARSTARQAEAPTPVVTPQGADTETAVAKALVGGDATTEAPAPAAKPVADAAPELASLLPGWPPAAPVVPVAAATAATPSPAAEARGTADAALAAVASPTRASLADGGHAAQATPRPEDHAAPGHFALPAASVTTATPTHDTPPVVQAHVAAPMDSPAFAPALATQVRWLVRDGLQHAQLSLNPAEMGPVTVQIVLDGREARIDFRADLAVTRNAIEASLPVLAAALDESGLRLSGGGVHDGQAQRHGQPGWAGARAAVPTGGSSGQADDTALRATASAALRGGAAARGLVDLVA